MASERRGSIECVEAQAAGIVRAKIDSHLGFALPARIAAAGTERRKRCALRHHLGHLQSVGIERLWGWRVRRGRVRRIWSRCLGDGGGIGVKRGRRTDRGLVATAPFVAGLAVKVEEGPAGQAWAGVYGSQRRCRAALVAGPGIDHRRKHHSLCADRPQSPKGTSRPSGRASSRRGRLNAFKLGTEFVRGESTLGRNYFSALNNNRRGTTSRSIRPIPPCVGTSRGL